MLEARKLPVFDESVATLALAPSPRGDVALLPDVTRRRRGAFRVAVVSMPFMSAFRPSIQLGLLKAIGESHGFLVDTFHLNLELAHRLDWHLYRALSEHRGRLTGDWLFSKEAFRDRAPDVEGRFVDEFADSFKKKDEGGKGTHPASDALRRRLTALRVRDEVIPAFLTAMMKDNDWGQYAVVGFSSVFQQNVASLALARRIKEAHPGVKIVFGGSNFDGDMGLEVMKTVDWIDHGVVGEGDIAFPELLIALSEGNDTREIPGVATRARGAVHFKAGRRPLENLDQLPTPRYEEYFSRAEATGLLNPAQRRTIPVPFESARGCWWGEKHHCTFCGLNNNGMKFRAKSPSRVAEELASLARTYRTFKFEAVDNIVDHDYLKSLFPHIVESGKDYKLFYEVKSNLTRDQLKSLKAGGVASVQPGIESLSTHVLRLMRKGVTAAQNVNTLRWARYYDITVSWNLLYGFPGESREDYAEQVKLLEDLAHIPPPSGSGRIWMERFSPIYADEAAFPRKYRRAEASYGWIYPADTDLDRVAYFFDYELEGTLEDSVYQPLNARIVDWLEEWKSKDRAPSLTYWFSDGFVQVADDRGGKRKGSYTFEGPLARLYVAASDRPLGVGKIIEKAKVKYSVADVERALGQFCEQGLMMRDGEHFLSLALPATRGR